MIDGDEDGRAEDDASRRENGLISTYITAFRVLEVAQHTAQKDGLTQSNDTLLKDKDTKEGHKLGQEGFHNGPGKVWFHCSLQLFLPLPFSKESV